MAEKSKQPKQIPADYATKLEAARAQRAMQGERRVLSILFCDVVGSTSMAEKLDPEDWAEIMDDAFDHLIAPIFRYEGTVARLMGDGLLAFFGAPIAHEDDPKRAVLAGLAIQQEIKPFCKRVKKEFGLEFNVRVGINTGTVVVGEIGSDLKMEYTAMGDAINLAARMEQSAAPGSVQISANTYKHVAPLFEVEDLGEIEVKGKSKPQPAYKVVRPKAEPGRVRGISGLTAPLIGREAEFTVATEAMQAVQQGRGGILMLLGQAGLGKTRLIEELRLKWIADQGDGAWLETRGISYDAGHPYMLFRNLLRSMCAITDYDSPDAIRQKLEKTVSQTPESHREQFRQAAEILLEVEGSDEIVLEGEALKKRLFKNLTSIFRAEADTAPFVLILDDLHWADDASIALLIHMLALVEEVPILFVCAMRTYRKSPGWRVKQTAEAEYPHRYKESSLKALSEDQSQELVDNLLDISELPPELHQLVMRKAEGNPFFVEEVVRTLIDNEFVQRDEDGLHWVSTQRVANIAIPDNLQGLLAARIDRLQQDVRQTLQLAAVIGRSFYFRVLAAISEIGDTLDSQLNT
ncbi:MAG: AAA family ATPase, partial [Chloroflexi bacterium]|nr:AAA family ATPase [Chloroflexota bacterium]